MLQWALKHFTGDYAQTALNSLHWREFFCRCPQYRNIWKLGQTTTPRDIILCEVHRFFYIPGLIVDRRCTLLSLFKKTRMSNHLQLSEQRQHVLLSCFKTLRVGPVWGSNPWPCAGQSSALQPEPTGNFPKGIWIFFCYNCYNFFSVWVLRKLWRLTHSL